MQRIRLATPRDAEALLAIYAPYVTDTCVTFEYDVPSGEAFAARIEGVLKRFPYLIFERDGEALGYCYAHPIHERAAYGWDAELSVYVRRDARGTGVGAALYRAMQALLTLQGILTLYVLIALPNEPSVGFHRANGFVEAATFADTGYKHGGWHAVMWMEKRLAPLPQRPAPVIRFGDLPGDAVEQALRHSVNDDSMIPQPRHTSP